MQHILVLSVIVLQHAASASCRALGRQPQPPAGDTAASYTQLKQRDYDITKILKQLLERSSTEIRDQKSLAKLTIEPYNKNTSEESWQEEDQIHWFNKNKKTIAPLAIILTSLPEINKLQNRDEDEEKQYLIQNNETPFYSERQDMESSKQIMNRDLNTEVKSDFIEDFETDNKGHDNLEVNSKDLEVSIEYVNLPNDLNKPNNSPFIDVDLQSKDEILFDELDIKDGSDEITKHSKSIENIDKISLDDSTTSKTDTIDFDDQVENNKLKDFSEEIPLEIKDSADDTVHEKQENLINILLDADFKVFKENNKHATANDDVLVNNEPKLTLKFKNDDNSIVVSEVEPPRGDEDKAHKCRKHLHDTTNTYNIYFLFNR